MAGLLSKQRIIAKPGFNRWWVPPTSIAIHLCIGSVYAWSIYNPALVKTLGVVASAPDDWSLRAVVWIFTVAIVFLGLSAAFAGRWLERVGPRMVGVVSAACWGGGAAPFGPRGPGGRGDRDLRAPRLEPRRRPSRNLF